MREGRGSAAEARDDMTSITDGGVAPERNSVHGAQRLAAMTVLAGGAVAAVIAAGLVFGFGPSLGVVGTADPFALATYAAAPVFLLLGGAVALVRPGLGGAIALFAALVYVAALLFGKSFGWVQAVPLVLGFTGSIGGLIANDRAARAADARLIYRQAILTRVTHWTWAIAMFFLLLSGLNIWNAHPALYIGQESGFEYDNAILRIGAENTDAGPRGFTTVFGQKFDTTGVLGMSGSAARPQYVGFPGWATIPSYRDLATGRVVHFFFAWIMVGALAIWLISSLANGHFWRDIVLKPRDIRELPRDIVDHIRLKFDHGKGYSPLQKLAYFGVFIVILPLIILTGLTMSPGMDAAWPWLLDIFGGRQTARTLHFVGMLLLVLFFVVHIVMVVLAGPFNELRSMITGYYRTKATPHAGEETGK
jgi:thiosulfate reductase cytochrome b subunit